MIYKIAFRNIWRNKVRSIVVITSVLIGVWALLFLLSFVRGQVNNYVSNVIENETSHYQIHHQQFGDDQEVQYRLNKDNLEALLNTNGEVKEFSPRVITNAMLSSARTAQGVMVKGIDKTKEARTTNLKRYIREGEFLESQGRNPIIISERMAEKLQVKLRSKLVLTFQDLNQELATAAFKVNGIFNTRNKISDELFVYARIEDLQNLIGLDSNECHEIAVVIQDINRVDEAVDNLKVEVDTNIVLVESYKEISPDLELFNSQIKINMIIMTVIFMLALIFGIINTMLMAVLERIRELGMLMSIGMNRLKVFSMILLETIYLAFLGAPLGMFLAYLTVRHFGSVGIDLSRWGSGLETFGMADKVYTVLTSGSYIMVGTAVFITAIIASIYPSIKAIRLNPVEAIRKI